MRILRKMFAANNNNNMAVADPLPAQRVQNQQAALQVKQQQSVNSQQRNMLSQQTLPVKQQQVANTKLKNGIRQHSLSIKRSADSSRAIAEVNKMVAARQENNTNIAKAINSKTKFLAKKPILRMPKRIIR